MHNKLLDFIKNSRNIFWDSVIIFLMCKLITLVFAYFVVPEVFWNYNEFIARFGSWDGNVYFNIAKSGYLYHNDLIVYSFLPGWPLILRFFSKIFTNLDIRLIGIILNQVLLLPFIYICLLILKKLEIGRLDRFLAMIFVLFYPAGAFFNFNYNEVIYLLGISLITLFWVFGLYSLAILAGIGLVLIRISSIVFVVGLVGYFILDYLYKQLQAKNFKLNQSLFQSIKNDTFRFLQQKWYLVLLFCLLPMPFLAWLWFHVVRFGENKYFLSQKLVFGRQTDYIFGPFRALLDALLITMVDKLNPAILRTQTFGEKIKHSFFFGVGMISNFIVLINIFNQKSIWFRILQYSSAVVAVLAIFLAPRYLLDSLYVDRTYFFILPLFLIFAGTWGLWKTEQLRFLILPCLFTLYLPLSTQIFGSMNRLFIHSFFLLVGFYMHFLRKNKLLYVVFLSMFMIGFLFTMQRFTHYVWPG